MEFHEKDTKVVDFHMHKPHLEIPNMEGLSLLAQGAY